MSEIKLTKRYPHSRTEDIADAYTRGFEDGMKMGRGECHVKIVEGMSPTPYYVCSECGNAERHPFKFCPECGRKVVSE